MAELGVAASFCSILSSGMTIGQAIKDRPYVAGFFGLLLGAGLIFVFLRVFEQDRPEDYGYYYYDDYGYYYDDYYNNYDNNY